MRIHLKFTKRAEILEEGGLSIEHDDPTDWAGIVQKASEKRFAEYLVSRRDYITEDWAFEPLPVTPLKVANEVS